jgi:formylglycine-generating enzyme required for sulfatase activity
VVLEPFFASKYEVTNAQWRLVVPGGHDHRGHPTTRVLYEPTHPLVEVQGELLLHVLEAWGIQLPSWQQWEYLARGGTEGPRWCGADERDLLRSANLYDEATGKGEGDRVKWSDGFGATAPVGSFRANPFLLYDVLGNVNEVVTRPSPNTSGLEIRGGSWNQGAAMARATSRVNWAGNALQTVGIRPVVLVKR